MILQIFGGSLHGVTREFSELLCKGISGAELFDDGLDSSAVI